MVYCLGELDTPTTPERGGDPLSREETMELIYRLHGRPLFRYLLRMTLGDRREAEDLVQETLLRAWGTCRTTRPTPSRYGRGCSRWRDTCPSTRRGRGGPGQPRSSSTTQMPCLTPTTTW